MWVKAPFILNSDKKWEWSGSPLGRITRKERGYITHRLGG